MKLSHVIVGIIAVFAFGFLGSMIGGDYAPAGWCGVGIVVTLVVGLQYGAFK